MSFYPNEINERFLRPTNAGDPARTDALGTVGSLTCGAVVRVQLTIDPGSQLITQARFKAVGCGYLIAAASVLMEAIEALRLGEAVSLPTEVIESVLGPAPENRRHCYELCREALENAALDYRSRQLESWTGSDPLVCTCFGVTEATIERLIPERALHTVEEVTRACNAGGGCGSCRPIIQEMLDFAGE
jgi:NifU-like protein